MSFRGKAWFLTLPQSHQEGVMDIAVAVRPDVQDPGLWSELRCYDK